MLLEPLTAADADVLVARLLDGATADDALRGRILDAAEGNPLFVEEMVALLRESPDGAVTVPPTIQALLAARLDQLDPVERVVLERGSVEGRVFHRGAVQALSPLEAQLLAPLTALVRRELVRPDRAQFPGEDAYRFRHLLIRDAAYDALPKAIRAELHERFALLDVRSRQRPRRARRGRRLPPRACLSLSRRARPGGRRRLAAGRTGSRAPRRSR